METNIVEKLLHGSENIDRMRREIKQVICLIFYQAFGEIRWRAKSVSFSSEDIEWKFDAIQAGQMRGWYYVFRSLRGRDELYSCYFEGGPESPTETHPSLEKIQKIHESLPILVEGMMKTWPRLNSLLEPVFKATDKFSSTK